jgi:hypothetical protein
MSIANLVVRGVAQMLERFYAHSIEGKPVDEWHRLEEHLKGIADNEGLSPDMKKIKEHRKRRDKIFNHNLI